MIRNVMMRQRNTQQRQIISEVLDRATRPLDAEEILALGRARLTALGIATVYRAIRTLLDSGEIVPVHVPDRPTCYERAGRGHHHHFFCRHCRKVFETEGCPGHLENLAPKGFEVEFHEITLHGRCSKCVKTHS